MKPVILAIHLCLISVSIASWADGNDGLTTSILNQAGDARHMGTSADERISGGSGSDVLRGMGGDDILNGGKGKDILYGGEGADRFVIDLDDALDTMDIVMDYEFHQQDSIVINVTLDQRRRLRLPERLGTEHFRVDTRGNVSIRLQDAVLPDIVSVPGSRVVLKAEDNGKRIKLTLKKRF